MSKICESYKYILLNFRQEKQSPKRKKNKQQAQNQGAEKVELKISKK